MWVDRDRERTAQREREIHIHRTHADEKRLTVQGALSVCAQCVSPRNPRLYRERERERERERKRQLLFARAHTHTHTHTGTHAVLKRLTEDGRKKSAACERKARWKPLDDGVPYCD